MDNWVIKEGAELFWLHGNHSHRVAVVVSVSEDDVVVLSGMTKIYTMRKEILIKKLQKTYPEYRGAF